MRYTLGLTRWTTAIVILLASGCSMFLRPPAQTEFARTRVSEQGRFRATITPAAEPISRGRLQTWTLHIETMDGATVDSATITVDGGMPQHGHGLPTKPLVTQHLGGGDHLVEGMKFNMNGWWVVKFHIGSAAGVDTVVFNLSL